MDREAWRAAVHGVARSRTRPSDWTELSDEHFHFVIPGVNNLSGMEWPKPCDAIFLVSLSVLFCFSVTADIYQTRMSSDSAGICFYTASDTKGTIRFYLVGTFFTNREVSLSISFKTKQLNAVSPPPPKNGNLHLIIAFFFLTAPRSFWDLSSSTWIEPWDQGSVSAMS